MGLDMYLYKKTFLWTGDWIKPEFEDEIKLTKGGKDVDSSKVKFIVEEVGYWRKANQIHMWFVDNVQNGEDDCREYSVDEEKLLELYRTCKLILDKDPGQASILLPIQSGFFFGGTEYDEYYFKDLENTVKIIESLFDTDSEGNITSEQFADGEISYRASW